MISYELSTSHHEVQMHKKGTRQRLKMGGTSDNSRTIRMSHSRKKNVYTEKILHFKRINKKIKA